MRVSYIIWLPADESDESKLEASFTRLAYIAGNFCHVIFVFRLWEVLRFRCWDFGMFEQITFLFERHRQFPYVLKKKKLIDCLLTQLWIIYSFAVSYNGGFILLCVMSVYVLIHFFCR